MGCHSGYERKGGLGRKRGATTTIAASCRCVCVCAPLCIGACRSGCQRLRVRGGREKEERRGSCTGTETGVGSHRIQLARVAREPGDLRSGHQGGEGHAVSPAPVARTPCAAPATAPPLLPPQGGRGGMGAPPGLAARSRVGCRDMYTTVRLEPPRRSRHLAWVEDHDPLRLGAEGSQELAGVDVVCGGVRERGEVCSGG